MYVFIRFFGPLPDVTVTSWSKSQSSYLWTHIQLWPKLDKFPFTDFRYDVHEVIGSLPAVILTFWWHQKLIQHTYEPKYICDQNWVKFPSSVSEIGCSQACWVNLPLTFWPQKLISTFMNPNTVGIKTACNSFNCFLRYGVHVFRMHRLTHGRRDPEAKK